MDPCGTPLVIIKTVIKHSLFGFLLSFKLLQITCTFRVTVHGSRIILQ